MKICNSFISLLVLSLIHILPSHGETFLSTGLIGGETGTVVDVPVYFSSEESIVGAEFIIEYNAAHLEVGGIRKGNAITDHEIFDDQETEGELKITILSMQNDLLEDGNLTIVSFTLLQDLESSQNHLQINAENTLLVSTSGQEFSFATIEPISLMSLDYSAALSPTKPAIGREISLEANADYPLTTFTWDFGDGNSTSGQSTSHTYDRPDSYLVTITATNPINSLSHSQTITVSSPYWELDAEDLGHGWKSFDWFGAYYDTSGTAWIFHQDLGWMYRHGETIDHTWFWSKRWQWAWLSNEFYPYVANDSGGWMYYLQGTTSPVRWYDYGLSQWLYDQ